MKRFLRIIFRFMTIVIVIAIAIPAVLSLLLKNDTIQEWVLKKVSAVISQKIDNEISIRRIDVSNLYTVKIYDFFVASPFGVDTLLYASEVSAQLDGFKNLSHDLSLSSIKLKKGEFNLCSNDSTTNIKVIIEKLRNKEKTNKSPFKLLLKDIEVEDLAFLYRKMNFEPVEYGINFQNLQLNIHELGVNDLNIIGDSISMEVAKIHTTEVSGVEIENLAINRMTLTPNVMLFSKGGGTLDKNSFFNFEFIKLEYEQWNMSDFVNRVPLSANITSSKIDFSTVAKFTRMRRNWTEVIEFSGDYYGTVSKMKGTVREAKIRSTTLKNTSYSITGIPDTENMIFDFKVDTMTTCVGDVMGVAANFATNEMAPLNETIVKDSMFGLKGEFYGKIKDFDAGCQFAMVNPMDGSGRVDINMRVDGNNTYVEGEVYTKNLYIPSFTNVKGLGNITCNINLNANLNKEHTVFSTNGRIDYFDYNSYRYQKIRLNGEFANKTFVGFVACSDPNLDFSFNGTLSTLKTVPSYNFSMDLKEANLVALGINKRDSLSLMSGKLLAQGSGTKLDDLNATIVIDELRYINHRDTTIAENTIRIEAINDTDSKFIGVTSDYIDVTFKGRDSYQKLLKYLTNSFKAYLPALQDKKDNNAAMMGRSAMQRRAMKANLLNENDFYYIKADIKKVNNIANIFVPSLELAEGTTLSFLFNPNANNFSFNFQSDFMSLEDKVISGISIDTKNEQDSIIVFARAEELLLGNSYIPGISVIGGVKNNNIYADAGFSSEDGTSYALVKSKSMLSRRPNGNVTTTIDILASTLCINNEIWHSGGVSKVVIDPNNINIIDFKLRTEKQSLNINGIVSNSERDTVILSLDNFSLTPFAFLGLGMGYNISGNISGDVAATAVLQKTKSKLFSELNFYNININNKKLQPAIFRAWWDKNINGTKVTMTCDSVDFIKGQWIPDIEKYNLDVNLKDFDISLISPFMTSIGKDVNGYADINVSVNNPNKYLSIDGTVDIKNMSAIITATNVKYFINAHAVMKDNQATIKNGSVTDGMGGTGTINAFMHNEKFKNVKYGFDINVNEMLCMNTTEIDNSIYYGKAFGTGNATIRGDRNKVTLSVNAATAKKSTFFLPLSGRTISEANFIKFVDTNKKVEEKNRIINRKNKKENTLQNQTAFEFKMRLDVKPNIEAEIVMDQATGSSLKATGTGVIDMDIRPAEEVFFIKGEYTIDKGTYRFILPNFNLVDKFFNIKPGGWIRWNGDPMGAVLNVDAIYDVKTSLAPLFGETYSNRVNVDCVLSVRGELQSPEIVLGIDLPDVDIESQSLVRSVLNTQEDISTQIFFLLFTGNFYPINSNTNGAEIGIAGTTSTGLEFLTNQIKNIFSSDKFDFGIKYRPQSTMTSNEIEFDFSAPILSDRLFLDVTWNYNMLDNPASFVGDNQRSFTGDFYLTWKINPDGNIYLKAFSKTIDSYDENQGMQESGVGIYYKLDFDNWQDLKTRYHKYKLQRKENKAKKKEKKEAKKKNKEAKREEVIEYKDIDNKDSNNDLKIDFK